MKKTIWIVNPYGTLPSEGWRDYRSYMLAAALAKRGNRVVWWISDFEHRSKKRRMDAVYNDPLLPTNVRIMSVRTRAYDRNISFGRIRYEKSFGDGFAALAPIQEAPDMVVLADPSLFYSAQVLSFINQVKCKLVVDILDLWPELFRVALPRPFRSFEKIFFAHLYSRRRKLLERADGVVAVSKDYLTATGVSPKKSCVSYLGVEIDKFSQDWPSKMDGFITKFARGRLVIAYAGTMGDAYDIGCVLKTIKLCEKHRLPVCFVFAGSGPKMIEVQRFCDQYSELALFLGPVAASKLPEIYAQCDVGLCSYGPGSTVSMPVKLYDYLAAGLYVFSALKTEIAEHLHANDCGDVYQAGNEQSLLTLIVKTLSNKVNLPAAKKRAASLGREFDSTLQHQKMSDFLMDLF